MMGRTMMRWGGGLRSRFRPRVHGVALAASLFVASGLAAQAPAELLDRSAGITVQDTRLEEVLQLLQRTAGVAIAYSPDLVPVERPVTCDCAGRTVAEALELILEGTGIAFTAARTQIRLVPESRPAVTATGGLSGIVVESETGAPAPYVMIQVNTGQGALSDAEGGFVIDDLPVGTYDVEVTGLGWVSTVVRGVAVRPGEDTVLRVRLARRAIPLSAVVVSPGRFGLLDEVSTFVQQTLTREEIETIPQLGEDVFRSIKRLPGVASDDVSTKLNVRGGYDRELMVRLDGVELYEPYHLKDFDGALGIVDIQSIGGIDLYSGGFPADFGNKLSGVLDMETRDPPAEGRRTTLGLSLTNASVLSQGGFANGRGQWLLSARRGYLDLAFKLTGVSDLSPRYYDLLGKVQYRLGSRHLVSAHVLWARDHINVDAFDDNDPDQHTVVHSRWGNGYAWLTWKAFLTPAIRMRTTASVGQVTGRRSGVLEDPGRHDGPEFAEVADDRDLFLAALRHEWIVDASDRLSLRAGLEAKSLSSAYDYFHVSRTLEVDRYGALVAVLDTADFEVEPAGTEAGVFGAVRVRPVPWATTEVGLRYDHHSTTGESHLSPRVHALVDVSDRTTLRASWGRYFQTQGLHELRVGDGEREFWPSEKATQTALGVEHRLENGVTARVEAYVRSVDQPRPEYVNLWREILPFPEVEADRKVMDISDSRARGIELLLKRDGQQWDWSATYALSSAQDRLDGKWIPRMMDQRHALTLSLGFHPDPKWFATAAWHYRSGWPYTSQEIHFDTVTVFRGFGGNAPLRWREEFGPPNAERLPAYHRLDLRVTRRFTLSRGRLDVYLDLFNAYDQPNVRTYEYDLDVRDGRVVRIRYPNDELLPILPSIGFRWEF